MFKQTVRCLASKPVPPEIQKRVRELEKNIGKILNNAVKKRVNEIRSSKKQDVSTEVTRELRMGGKVPTLIKD